jgi:hypothetical protein
MPINIITEKRNISASIFQTIVKYHVDAGFSFTRPGTRSNRPENASDDEQEESKSGGEELDSFLEALFRNSRQLSRDVDILQ